MNYLFPRISHLDEVREAIEGSPEFIVAERDWGYVVNYLVMTPDAFPPVVDLNSAIRRECRGLIFNRDGELISRPLHKFFTVNQVDETQAHRIDLSQPHVILEKLDGSMIRPIPVGAAYRLGTKMGISDVSMQAEVFVADHPDYDSFIRACIASGITPIFEWCSRKQRIVVDYPEDRLVLIAARNIRHGTYMGIDGLRGLAEAWNLDLVRQYEGTACNMQALLDETRDIVGQEGWIIRFDDGHMVKCKGEDYLRRHHAKDAIGREKDTIAMLLADKLDDVKQDLEEGDRHRLERFEREFWQGVSDTAAVWSQHFDTAKGVYGSDRKGFALEWAPRFEANERSAIFRAWDLAWTPAEWRQAVVDVIAKNTGTATKVDAVRALWGGGRWDFAANTGDE